MSLMCRSNTPSVDGLVNMMPAVFGPSTPLSASMSTSPSGSVGISFTTQPHMFAVAGLVPCAASGTMTSVRPVSPRASWYAFIIATPASSPCAPAIGVSDTPRMPVTSLSISCSSYMHSRNPWPWLTGPSGCRPANSGSNASALQARGLYFIVHEPSG